MTFNNLSLDVKGLEEGGLFWVHTGGAGRNGHISRGDGADSSGGLSDLGVEDLLDVGEITIAEDHASVKHQLRADKSEVRTGDAGFGVLVLEVENGGLHKGLKRELVWSVGLRFCP